MKTALVTGISGQDGAYLAKLLLDKGYEVHGALRYGATPSLWRLEEWRIARDVRLFSFEILEAGSVIRTIERIQPDEIYNLAAISYVAPTFDQPLYALEANGAGPVRLLEAIRCVNPAIKFYQASTSEMFGKVCKSPQDEGTPFYPRSPYAAAKLYGHWMTVNYRESHGLHAVSGILFNHESPLRSEDFVTRKITAALARIKLGRQDTLRLGNLGAERDWGFAGDYVRGMWMMLQAPTPADYVLATGQSHNIRRFAECAARGAGFDLVWHGGGDEETGIDRASGKTIIQVDPELYRPSEVDRLRGDSAKAARDLGWSPTFGMESLAAMMVEADLKRERAR